MAGLRSLSGGLGRLACYLRCRECAKAVRRASEPFLFLSFSCSLVLQALLRESLFLLSAPFLLCSRRRERRKENNDSRKNVSEQGASDAPGAPRERGVRVERERSSVHGSMDPMDLFKENVLAQALALAVAPREATRDRGMAARIAAEILDHVDWNEARAADVMAVLRRSVEGRFDAFGAVDALVDVLRRKESRHLEKVLPALARVAERAHARSFIRSLHAVLIVLLDEGAEVRTEWVDAVVRWGATRAVSRDSAGEVLNLYLAHHGTDHAWLRRVVQDHPHVLSTHWLAFAEKQQLHRQMPTSEGWLYFVEFSSENVLAPWDPAEFGPDLPTAIKSLGEALAQARSEGTDAKSVVLAEWLSRLLVPA